MSSEDDDSSSGSSAEASPAAFTKPTFVPKTERARLLEELASEEASRRRDAEEVEEQRKAQAERAHTLVADLLEAERRAAAERERLTALGLASVAPPEPDAPMPDDSIQAEDQKAEFEKWQQRELARLKRDWLREHRAELERAAVERRRDEDSRLKQRENEQFRKELAEQAGVQKGKMNFMQKYYHRGAFYQNVVETGAEEAFKKDFNRAVAEEQIDLTLLPKALQVRRGDFGKRSRSKYTHLKDQDTTDNTAGWNKRARS